MVEEKPNEPGALSQPPSTNPNPPLKSSAPPAPPSSSGGVNPSPPPPSPSPPKPEGRPPVSPLMTPTSPPSPPSKKSADILQVEVGKDALKNFEIRTMSDDLARAKGAPLASSAPRPPSPPPPSPQSSSLKTPSPPPATATLLKSSPPPAQPPEFLFEEEPKRGGALKSFLLGFVVVLLLGTIGLGGWWYVINRSPEGDGPPPPPPPPPPVVSTAPLIPIDQTFTLALDAQATKRDLLEELKSLTETARADLPEGDLGRIAITQNEEPLPLSQLEGLLDVVFSPHVDKNLFTLVFSRGSPGSVFGLVLKITDSEIGDYMTQEESNIPFLANELYTSYTDQALPAAASETFLDNVYQGVAIRYINFDTPERSFDYAIYEDLLLLGGSRDMIFNLINRARLRDLLNESS